MTNLLVVDDASRWELPNGVATLINASEYLTPQSSKTERAVRVFNLCDSYSYQSLGYYVSLLAEARGQHAIPSVATLRDFRSLEIARSFGAEIEEIIEASLKKESASGFTLSIYFGQTVDQALGKLGTQIYRLFPAPLILAEFQNQGGWRLNSVVPISFDQVPAEHRDRVSEFAARYFNKRHSSKVPKQRYLYDMAILVNPDEPHPPSNERALRYFKEAAHEIGFYVETITNADAARLCEFDALFIRETTAVDHPTYQLSRLAHAEGLVVIDDPWSILRSANKVYLAEILSKAKLPSPTTTIFTRRDLVREHCHDLTFPIVLKLPDAAFSMGVKKAANEEQFRSGLKEMLKESELIIGQEYTPSEYDWRIGVLDHQPLFACKYHMAEGHWQIYNWGAKESRKREGKSEAIHVEFVPPAVIDLALRASALIGDGFYGVDIKEVGNRLLVIEVNDNPSVDAGVEDAALGMELYRRIARSFRRRIQLARS
jgi:glutathione synthase/RimK-type ligase-like ATP-grasp enzyme